MQVAQGITAGANNMFGTKATTCVNDKIVSGQNSNKQGTANLEVCCQPDNQLQRADIGGA